MLTSSSGMSRVMERNPMSAFNPFAKKQVLNESVTPSSDLDVKVAVRSAIAANAAEDKLIESPAPSPEIVTAEDERVVDARKLSQLVDDNFPFDESQIAAI